MNKKIKTVIIIILILIIISGAYYITDVYHADKSIKIENTSTVNISKISNGLFIDGEGNDTALIFYPGAKVEYTSYLPLLTRLAEDGVDSYLVEMPLNLAFLGQNSADDILNSTDYDNYYLAGHSLGGAMAASYVNKSDDIDGLILLASYSTVDINIPVLSIYGSEDKVLNHEKYDESKVFLHNNTTEVIIDGGNHAQFGNYGNQSGDGIAEISCDKQQRETVLRILEFIA